MATETEEKQKVKKSKNKKKEEKKEKVKDQENGQRETPGDENEVEETATNPFDVAGMDAETAFVRLLKKKGTDKDTVTEIANWIDAWVPSAGLKRLGRILRAQKG